MLLHIEVEVDDDIVNVDVLDEIDDDDETALMNEVCDEFENKDFLDESDDCLDEDDEVGLDDLEVCEYYPIAITLRILQCDLVELVDNDIIIDFGVSVYIEADEVDDLELLMLVVVLLSLDDETEFDIKILQIMQHIIDDDDEVEDVSVILIINDVDINE